MGSYLVVANRTLSGERLAAHLGRLIDADPDAEFTVVVPLATPVPTETAGVLGGMAVVDLEQHEFLRTTAESRLQTLLSWLTDAGATASGRLAAGDPVAAMEEASSDQSFDEIIISTLPPGVSRWLRLDLVHRAARRFAVPITTVVGTASDDAFPPATGRDAPAASSPSSTKPEGGVGMAESVYKIIELVGTSTESWEKAATAAVTKASQTLRDLRVAEVAELDLVIDDGAVTTFRAKLKVSFKYEGDQD